MGRAITRSSRVIALPIIGSAQRGLMGFAKKKRVKNALFFALPILRMMLSGGPNSMQ